MGFGDEDRFLREGEAVGGVGEAGVTVILMFAEGFVKTGKPFRCQLISETKFEEREGDLRISRAFTSGVSLEGFWYARGRSECKERDRWE